MWWSECDNGYMLKLRLLCKLLMFELAGGGEKDVLCSLSHISGFHNAYLQNLCLARRQYVSRDLPQWFDSAFYLKLML